MAERLPALLWILAIWLAACGAEPQGSPDGGVTFAPGGDAWLDAESDSDTEEGTPIDPGHCVPGPEMCNGIDDDCDGQVDEDFLDLNSNGIADCYEARYRGQDVVDPKADAVDPPDEDVVTPPPDTPWAPDADMDGDPDASDCAPQDPTIHHGATEVCNGQDDNCDGALDEGFPNTDGDGQADCVDPDDDGDGTPDADDCDPLDAGVHPGVKEVCNGADDDCDGTVDPEGAAGCIPFHKDGDNDGHGSDATKCLCAPSGAWTLENGGDCDDGNDQIHPGAKETCNGKDDDCDGKVDPAGTCQTVYKICIDPGDGGSNPGAVGIVTEKNVNLAMGLKARDWLKADTQNNGGGGSWTVLMTRDTDKQVSLASRVEYANSNGAHRFISVHNNSCGGCGGTGTESYKKPGADGNASDLTGKVQDRIVAALGLNNRGVKVTDFYVLTHTSMPATVTFPGFVDTQKDVNLINSSGGQSNTGKAILHAVQQHFGYAAFTP